MLEEAAAPEKQDGVRVPEPFSLVIFGATGDLAHRKLIPAVFNLFRQGLLPDDVSVIGFARRDKTDEGFRAELLASLQQYSAGAVDQEAWDRFAPRIAYHRAAFEDAEGFRSLRRRLSRNGSVHNALFYLAVQPDSISTVIGQLCDSGLARRGAVATPWARVVVEKPFGRDLASARELNGLLRTAFDEEQIFRIDHYLGKEGVQNLLVLRFANSIFEPVWNQKYIDHVQITASETIGIEGRAHYYEQAGALRDMVQNHVMHLLSLVAMEPPSSLGPDAVRDEKVKVIRALRRIPPECVENGVIRAQYGAGRIGGRQAPGYREEEDIPPDSNTETYVAFRAFIDNWRWAGVPFYIRTGKRMATRITEITIHFRPVPNVLFNVPPAGPLEPNVLAIRIQPNEGVSLRFQEKSPGPAMRIASSQMDFSYASLGQAAAEAYERLLLDAALGDPTLFTRSDEVEAAWEFVDPVVSGCAVQRVARLPVYAAGSWGPKEADALIQADGREWVVLRRPRPH